MNSLLDKVKKSPVTTTLLVANLAVFAWVYGVVGSFDEPQWTNGLFKAGGLYNPLALDGQPWRLFTHMFLHGHLLHLAFNMYALGTLGLSWERYIGSSKWISIYFLTGLGASLATLGWNYFTLGVGASGAIFGLFGFVLVELWRFNRSQQTSNRQLLLNFAVFLGVNILLAGFFNADNAAHLGGLVCGMALSGLNHAFRRKGVWPELMMASFLVAVFFALPRNQVQFYKAFHKTVALEDSLQQALRKSVNDSEVVAIFEHFPKRWHRLALQIKAITPMPDELKRDTMVLLRHIAILQREAHYRAEMVKRESYLYLDSIEWLMQARDTIPPISHPLMFQEASIMPPDSAQAATPTLEAVRVLYDSNWVETDTRPFVYFREGRRDTLGRWQGPVRDYFGDGSIQMKGNYENDLHHGIFIYYSKSGGYEAAGKYHRDQRVGKWEQFHSNGILERELFYNQEGEFVATLWDSLGNVLIKNGAGYVKRTRLNGTVEEEGFYKQGAKEGVWKGNHPDGAPYFEEYYEHGRLETGRSLSRDGRRFNYDGTSHLALPAGGWANYRAYLAKAAKLYRTSKSGRVGLYFRVTPDSRITDIIVQQSLDFQADRWAKEIVQKGPKWLPARLHGQEITDGFGFVVIEFEE